MDELTLTVGIACRNGLPHLTACLDALPAVAARVPGVRFVLVDSGSSDGTLAAMQAFAGGRADTRVLSMQGHVNLSATRNVILDAAGPGPVFLVDGDVAVEPGFVAAALAALAEDRADIVFGRLPEVLYDGQHRRIAEGGDRYAVGGGGPCHLFHGIVMLGPAVTAARPRYDPRLTRCEDTDMSIRLSGRFRILALPMVMGIHHTVSYYHADRRGAFYREQYTRPLGALIRKHLAAPRRLWHGHSVFAGVATGLATQALLAAALATGQAAAIAAALALMALDFAQLALRGRYRNYVPVRLVGAWFLVLGFLAPRWDAPDFQLVEAAPRP
ncbi:MAG: glycosyltransferase [Hyphomicrobiales bacterium]|nr:glycosyltransferase [Hyphomicrobiales bacterium]